MRHSVRLLITSAAFVAVFALLAPKPSAESSRLQDILARAADYLALFVSRFANIVAEEKYTQDAKTYPNQGKGKTKTLVLTRGMVRHVELVSDFLLVRSREGNQLYSFRDVYSVNGEPVRDRQDRLVKLFVEPTTTAGKDIEKIAYESARYTFGGDRRTLNNPLVAIGFLQSVYQPRFKFSLRGADPEVGKDVWMIEYEEKARPTLIRMIPDGDLVSKGRFWIEEATGRVVKTEVTVLDTDTVVTLFRFDDRFQIAVPYEMREDFWMGAEVVSGVATYDRFRQFSVNTVESFDSPPGESRQNAEPPAQPR